MRSLKLKSKEKRNRQVGALVYRRTKKGIKILIITSRGTGRWILPKGWQMPKTPDSEAARIEAWEEAGVKNQLSTPTYVGQLRYDKTLSNNKKKLISVALYSFETDRLAKKFPEKGQRNIKWVRPQKAYKLLKQPELKPILKKLSLDCRA